jgi:hypothetical protein
MEIGGTYGREDTVVDIEFPFEGHGEARQAM